MGAASRRGGRASGRERSDRFDSQHGWNRHDRAGQRIRVRLPDLIANAVCRHPARACVIAGERSITFADVDDRAGRLAQALVSHGAGHGQRIALLARNEPEYFEIQVAAQRAGAILVPLNYRLAIPELRAILADCEPLVLIHGPEYDGHAGELGIPLSWRLGAGGGYEQALADVASPVAGAPLDASAPCAILYTSGTTGRAKGAVISTGCLWARLNLFSLELRVGSDDSLLFPIPMFHTSCALAYAFAYVGATVVLMR